MILAFTKVRNNDSLYLYLDGQKIADISIENNGKSSNSYLTVFGYETKNIMMYQKVNDNRKAFFSNDIPLYEYFISLAETIDKVEDNNINNDKFKKLLRMIYFFLKNTEFTLKDFLYTASNNIFFVKDDKVIYYRIVEMSYDNFLIQMYSTISNKKKFHKTFVFSNNEMLDITYIDFLKRLHSFINKYHYESLPKWLSILLENDYKFS